MTSDVSHTLITAIELAAMNANLDAVLLIDARFRLEDTGYGRRAYAQSHIPGALYLHLDEDLSSAVVPGVTGRHPLPDPALLEARLREIGLRSHMPVVVYDDGPGFFASRVWWLLNWLGHAEVRVLDGGIAGWKHAGLPLTSAPAVKTWPGDFVAYLQADMVVSTAELEQSIKSGVNCLIDARAPERFFGKSEPIDPVAGHIPRAVCVPCSANIASDGFFLAPDLLAKRFPVTKLARVCYCGSGVTACHNILAAVVAGLPMPRLYAGSWSEWITDPARPVATSD